MAAPKFKSKAVLVGYDWEEKCIYSEIVDLSDYYDQVHVWDRATTVKSLKLRRVKGYLFDSSGNLEQEFESFFDLATGKFKKGICRYANGEIQELT